MRVLIPTMLVALAACAENPDPAMWQCQLEVQKANAGKSAEAAAERTRAIHACMEAAGYRLRRGQANCSEGRTDGSCYTKR
jgi:hypothetical protein